MLQTDVRFIRQLQAVAGYGCEQHKRHESYKAVFCPEKT